MEDGKVAQISWDGAGCSISMASASVLSELGEGLTVDELHALLRDRVGEFRIVGTFSVYIDLDRPVGDDRRFLQRIALAANGQREPW